jgi:hypothetical protein
VLRENAFIERREPPNSAIEAQAPFPHGRYAQATFPASVYIAPVTAVIAWRYDQSSIPDNLTRITDIRRNGRQSARHALRNSI